MRSCAGARTPSAISAWFHPTPASCNRCPEYGATIAIFPIDEMSLDYMRLTGREPARVELVEAYARAQGLFRSAGDAEPIYSETIELDLSTVEPSLAGPRRPQDRVAL